MAKRGQKVVLRKKKKIQKKKKLNHCFSLMGIVALSFVLMLAGYLYLPGILKQWDLLMIKIIDVQGVASKERLADVDEFLGRWKNISVLELKKANLKQEITDRFPEYRVKDCSYIVPDGLRINLEMREGLGYVNSGEKSYILDGEGVAYSGGDAAGLPEMVFADEESRISLLKFLRIWDEENFKLHKKLKKIAVRDNNEVELFLEDGTKITWGDTAVDEKKMAVKFEYLKTVLDDALKRYGDLRYVNMRYLNDGRILVKPAWNVPE